MKRIIYRILPLLILITFFSCSKEDITDENSSFFEEVPVETMEIYTQDPVYRKILRMGFSPKQIKSHDDYFLVDGDISFPKDISFYGENNIKDLDLTARHAHSDNLISLINLKIYVFIHPSIPTGDLWRAALSSALSDWNSITGFGIDFVLTNSEYGANITVISDYGVLPDDTIADAVLPLSNGRSGNRIRVNLNNFSNYSLNQRRYVMVHELGHSIGFRHTDWENLPKTGGGYNLIPGTPPTDYDSVMTSNSGGRIWGISGGFTAWDLVAARFLYPYALKWDWVNVSEQSTQDGESSVDNVYLNFYTDATYTQLTNLPIQRTLSYNFITSRSAPYNHPTTYPQQIILNPGSSQYYINQVDSACWYDYGTPYDCFEEYLEFVNLN